MFSFNLDTGFKKNYWQLVSSSEACLLPASIVGCKKMSPVRHDIY